MAFQSYFHTIYICAFAFHFLFEPQDYTDFHEKNKDKIRFPFFIASSSCVNQVKSRGFLNIYFYSIRVFNVLIG